MEENTTNDKILSGAISVHICHSEVIKMTSLGSNGREEPKMYGQYANSFKDKEDELPLAIPDSEWDD